MVDSTRTVASILGVPAEWLDALILFESGNDPLITNKISKARGLIQFMKSTAQWLGYYDQNALVMAHPDYTSQINGPVKEYLKRYMPFPTQQSLYMTVFYPAARDWPLHKEFPENVQKQNKGIVTVGDYVRKVNNRYALYCKNAALSKPKFA